MPGVLTCAKAAEVAGLKSVWWPASSWNGGRDQIGTGGRIKSESAPDAHEVLAPTLKNIESAYVRGFAGMTRDPVALDDLLAARSTMVEAVVGGMSPEHRAFLISFERGAPEWSLLGLPHAADLLAVRWRQANLDKLPPAKRAQLVARLKEVLRTGNLI